MKKIYKVPYPVEFQIFEVQDDYVVTLSFVEKKPLEDLVNEQSQFSNSLEQKWEEAVTQDYIRKLNLLENLANGLEVSDSELEQANEKLTAKAKSLAQINSRTMPTSPQNIREIDAIKEQIEGVK